MELNLQLKSRLNHFLKPARSKLLGYIFLLKDRKEAWDGIITHD